MLKGFSEISYKVAGTVIASIILGLGGLTYGFTIGNKVEKSQYELHCLRNERDFSQFQWEIGAQRGDIDLSKAEIGIIKTDVLNNKMLLKDIDAKFNLILYRLERIEKKIDK